MEFKMTHFQARNVPTDSEISAMAAVLDRRYGVKADGVAEHFVQEHEAVGDNARAVLWSMVRARLACKAAPATLS